MPPLACMCSLSHTQHSTSFHFKIKGEIHYRIKKSARVKENQHFVRLPANLHRELNFKYIVHLTLSSTRSRSDVWCFGDVVAMQV